jgi:hypothetical protein
MAESRHCLQVFTVNLLPKVVEIVNIVMNILIASSWFRADIITISRWLKVISIAIANWDIIVDSWAEAAIVKDISHYFIVKDMSWY